MSANEAVAPPARLASLADLPHKGEVKEEFGEKPKAARAIARGWAYRPGSGLNSVFTRIVNHWVIV
jgi:hypothetical protein